MTLSFFANKGSLALMYAVILSSATAYGAGPAPNQFEIDLNELKKTTESGSKAPARKTAPAPAPEVKHSRRTAGGGESSIATYTVKPGDNLFRILMRDFGMSNREAELLIPEVVRINGLASSTSLSTGKKLSIPLERRAPSRHRTRHAVRQTSSPEQPGVPATETAPEQKAEQVMSLEPADRERVATTAPTDTADHNLVAPPPPQSDALIVDQTELEPSDEIDSPVSVKSVTGSSPDEIADKLLASLVLPWEPDKVINGKSGTAGENGAFSVKVDRCLTYRGKRYVVTVNSLDPFTYTMLRLVETAEYKVIHLDGQSNFIQFTSNLLSQLGIPFTGGKYRFIPPTPGSAPTREIEGIMVAFPDRPTRIFLTSTPLDPVTAENLSSFDAEKL